MNTHCVNFCRHKEACCLTAEETARCQVGSFYEDTEWRIFGQTWTQIQQKQAGPSSSKKIEMALTPWEATRSLHMENWTLPDGAFGVGGGSV